VRHVCAWCKREYGASDDAPGSDFVTHGICEKCEAFFEANQPKSLRQFLDGFDIPILCVDANVQVLTANDAACRLLAKDHDDIGDFLCGDVVQCRWARLPEGCGGTEHCVGCAIRLMVKATLESGKNVLNCPAYVDRELEGGGQQRIHLVLSTERHGELVLLRIDEMELAPPPPART
jgi:hypothetical protein